MMYSTSGMWLWDLGEQTTKGSDNFPTSVAAAHPLELDLGASE